jgi:integrase
VLFERSILTNLVRPHRLTPDVLGTLRYYARSSRAGSTQRAYASQWRAFDRWCTAYGCQSLPAAPISVAAYLAQRARAKAALATLNVSLAAIAFAHKAAGLPFDRSHPELAMVLAGIRREHVRMERQAEPLTGALMRRVLAGLDASPAGLRDAALLAVLYSAALRCSEAAALDWMQAGSGRGWLAIESKYAEIVLLGSKAAPGSVERVLIPANTSPQTLRAIKRWLRHAGIRPGAPLLRPLTRSGHVRPGRLHADSISRILQRVMLAHFVNDGLPFDQALAQARRFTSHSARVGFCVSTTEAGVPAQHIADVLRHRGLAMTRRYSKQARMLKCAPHARKGVGV